MLNSAEHEIWSANKSQITNTVNNSYLLNKAGHEIYLLLNKKMPTTVGIYLIPISREYFMLSSIEHEHSIIKVIK